MSQALDPAPPHRPSAVVNPAARREPMQPARGPAESGVAGWTCPSCEARVTTPFCATCGEEPAAPRDLTLRGLAARLIHAGTSIDARTIRTARRLLRHPGELTRAWLSGVRKAYVAPFQLFLIANVIFFALQWLTGETALSSSLASHLHHQDWSELAQALVSGKLQSTHTTLDLYTPVFDRAVVVNAKSLIVLMTLPFALLLSVVFWRRHRPVMAHVVFSLHLYTFLLLFFCLGLAAAKLSALLGFGGLESARVDNVLSVVNAVACALYLFTATGPVYGATGAMRLAQTAVLTIAVGAIVVGYRFVVFLVTLYTT
jgi:hypothetical protein